MPAHNNRVKLAVQRDGRMTDETVNLLKSMGLNFELHTRSLFSPCMNFPLDVLFVRDDDIPEYVQDGVSDLGIVGENVLAEKHARVKIIQKLGFGKCRLVLCSPKNGKIKRLSQLKGKRIATSYPATLRRFLTSNNISSDIVEISGSVEITPTLNVADATCDIISTGSTARMNGLEVMHTIMESEAALVANGASLKAGPKKRAIDQLLLRVRSTLSARGKKYIMMNAPLEAVSKLKVLIPGMKSPTVVPLAAPDMVAIHSVVGEEVFWEVIENLKQAGATDIVVVPIEKIAL